MNDSSKPKAGDKQTDRSMAVVIKALVDSASNNSIWARMVAELFELLSIGTKDSRDTDTQTARS
jgi:hypothetical protein